MLIVELKPDKEILYSIANKKVFVIQCRGCEEVYFPTNELTLLLEKFKPVHNLVTDFVCNSEYTKMRLDKLNHATLSADIILTFSCGIGLQTVANILENRVLPGTNTIYLPGFQGLTPFDVDCDQCGDCLLDYTGGICPITACSKGLLNGPCGGAKNGKCEISKEKDCGWEKIYNKLVKMNRLKAIKEKITLRDYSK